MSTRIRLAALALFGVALAWRFLTFTGFTNDQYGHLALGHQMLLGDRPIRDFFDPGWPLQYLASAAAWQMFDGAMLGEWAVAALAFATGAAFTALTAHRLSGSVLIAALVTIAEILIAPRPYSYPKILPYAAAAWVMVSATGAPSRRRLALLGVIVAVGFLLRHDHGPFLAAAAAVYASTAAYPQGIGRAAAAVATLGAATVAALLPWLAYVSIHGGVVPYFRRGLEFAGQEANATLLEYLPAFRMASPFGLENAAAWLFWLFWTLPLVCGGMLIVRARRGTPASAAPDLRRGRPQWTGELAALAGLVVMAIVVNAGFIRQELQVRLPDAIVPAALLGAWTLGACWNQQWRHRSLQRLAECAALAVVIVSLAAIGSIAGLREQVERIGIARGLGPAVDYVRQVSHLLGQPHRQTLSPPGRVSETLMPFYEYLDRCSSPSDRLIVTAAAPDVPVLAGRRFAGDGAAFSSGYSPINGQQRTLERLVADPPLFVVVIEHQEFREEYPLIDAYVTQAFQPMAVVSGTWPEDVPILVQRARRPTGTDAETGWPCFR